MVQYEVIACSAPCQGSSQQTQNSLFFLSFFYFTALLSHTGTAWMNTPKLLYLCASCYYSITYQRVSVMFAYLHVCACAVTKTFNHVRNNWASPDSRYKNKNKEKKKTHPANSNFIRTAPRSIDSCVKMNLSLLFFLGIFFLYIYFCYCFLCHAVGAWIKQWILTDSW